MNPFNKKYNNVPNLSVYGSIREIGRNPFVDWLTILLIGFICTAGLIYGGFLLYEKVIDSGSQGSTAAKKSVSKIFDKKELQSIIKLFDLKAEIQAQIKKGFGTVKDPSL